MFTSDIKTWARLPTSNMNIRHYKVGQTMFVTFYIQELFDITKL